MKQQHKTDKVTSVGQQPLAYMNQYLVAEMNNSSKVHEIVYLK